MAIDALPLRRSSVGYAWYVVGVLFIVTVLSQFDRQLTSLLVTPLKRDLGIGDTQFSLLHGYAFAVTYSILGIPFGRLVDRRNRRNLIVVGLLIWTTTTVLAAFASSYSQLLVARMGVGIGEAVLAPAAYSMIADLFDQRSRGRAIGAYYTSLAVGSGASYILGGLLLRAIPGDGIVLPGGLAMANWQAMFFFAGVPGFAVVLLLLTIAEPSRQEVRERAGVSVREFLRHLWIRRTVFLRLFAVPALIAVAGYGLLGWAPALFERRFGITPMRSGATLGLTVIATGIAGPLLAGWLRDRWTAAGRPSACLRVILVACCVLVPASTWALMPTPVLCFAAFAVTLLALSMAQSVMPVALHDIVFNEMRGQVVALYLLISGLVGIGFGPTSVALLTEYLFRDDSMLPYSLIAVVLPAAVISVGIVFSGLKPYQAAWKERWEAA